MRPCARASRPRGQPLCDGAARAATSVARSCDKMVRMTTAKITHDNLPAASARSTHVDQLRVQSALSGVGMWPPPAKRGRRAP
jgi:hypothetical protein